MGFTGSPACKTAVKPNTGVHGEVQPTLSVQHGHMRRPFPFNACLSEVGGFEIGPVVEVAGNIDTSLGTEKVDRIGNNRKYRIPIPGFFGQKSS